MHFKILVVFAFTLHIYIYIYIYIYICIYIILYIYIYLIKKTMCPPGSRLSPQWLCGSSCTCAQDVYTYDNMITSILYPSFCEIWALCVSWITYGHLYICIYIYNLHIYIYIYNLHITVCMYTYIWACCVLVALCIICALVLHLSVV